jgi:hypothetical protein
MLSSVWRALDGQHTDRVDVRRPGPDPRGNPPQTTTLSEISRQLPEPHLDHLVDTKLQASSHGLSAMPLAHRDDP